MILINLETHDPFFNLALEEVLLKRRKEDYFLIGSNDMSVIIGKHQAAHREVDTKFVTGNKIPVIRRISGGGTVFHDAGNLNFAFIRQSEEGKQIDFPLYLKPVIDFLGSLGVTAKIEGKSDIKVDGLKVSGNAEHVYRNRVLHHGTLLFNASIDLLRNSIRADKSCYTTRAVVSNPSSVMNLGEKLNTFSNINDFRDELMHYISVNMADIVVSSPSPQDTADALSLAETRYRQWEWNFAYGPEYRFTNTFLINNRLHSCILEVREGVVAKCGIDGSPEMIFISERLKGRRHMVSDFLNVFGEENIHITEEEVYNFF